MAAHVRTVFIWGKPVIHIQHKLAKEITAKVSGIRTWAEKFRPAKTTLTQTHTFCTHRHKRLLMWGWEVGKLHVGGGVLKWMPPFRHRSLLGVSSNQRETPFYFGAVSLMPQRHSVHMHFCTWWSSTVCATFPFREPECSCWPAAI